MKSAAFFDMDGTLLRGESQFAFLLQCLRRGLAPRGRSAGVAVTYGAYLLGWTRNAARLRDEGFNLLTGLPPAQLEHEGSLFFRNVLARRIRRHAAALVAAHRTHGHFVVLITSATEAIARPVAEHLGMSDLIATRLITQDGRLTGARERPEPYGPGKRELAERFCAEHSIAPNHCFAYTDHVSDTPLLEFVGNPVAVNPTQKLRQYAVACGWPIADLEAQILSGIALIDPSLPC